MQKKPYPRGRYPRGHKVRCKHCGHSFEEHQRPEMVRHPKNRWKGFRATFLKCGGHGYEPKDLQRWICLEDRYAREDQRRFEMEVRERWAQGDAAWGRYVAIGRQQNHDRDLADLQRKVASAPSYGRERAIAKDELEQFLRRAQNASSFMVIGFGYSGHDEDMD